MCFSAVLVKINCDQENKIKIDNSVLNELINEIDQSATSLSENLVRVGQEIQINNDTGGVIRCKNFNITNKQIADIQFYKSFESQQTADLKTKVENAVTNESSQSVTNGVLAAFANSGDITNEATLNNAVKNIVKNAITQDMIDQAFSATDIGQTIILNNKGTIEAEQDCNFLNDGYYNIRSIQLTKNLQGAIQNNSVLTTIQNTVGQFQESGNELGNLFTTIGIIVGAIIGVVILLAVGVVLIKVLKK
jgi:hypothetical protein